MNPVVCLERKPRPGDREMGESHSLHTVLVQQIDSITFSWVS